MKTLLLFAVFILSSCSVDRILGKHTAFVKMNPGGDQCLFRFVVEQWYEEKPNCPRPGPPEKVFSMNESYPFKDKLNLTLYDSSSLHRNVFKSGEFVADALWKKTCNLDCELRSNKDYSCTLQKNMGDFNARYHFKSLTIVNEICGSSSTYVQTYGFGCNVETVPLEVKLGNSYLPTLSFH